MYEIQIIYLFCLFFRAMLYGSLGIQIAREMLRTVSAVGLGWNSRGLLEERTAFTNRLEFTELRFTVDDSHLKCYQCVKFIVIYT